MRTRKSAALIGGIVGAVSVWLLLGVVAPSHASCKIGYHTSSVIPS